MYGITVQTYGGGGGKVGSLCMTLLYRLTAVVEVSSSEVGSLCMILLCRLTVVVEVRWARCVWYYCIDLRRWWR